MLGLLQETLLYIQEQDVWLTCLQSAIIEKKQKYKLLQSKLNNFINEELKQCFNAVNNSTVTQKEVVVKQECFDGGFDDTDSVEAYCNVEEQSVSNYGQDGEDTSSSSQFGIMREERPDTTPVKANNDNTSAISWQDKHFLPEHQSTNLELGRVEMIYDDNCDSDQEESGNLNKYKLGPYNQYVQSSPTSSAEVENKETGHPSTYDVILHTALKKQLSDRVNAMKCNRCDREFKSKSTLIIHMRTHTGEKPFKCKLCNRSFSQTSSWKRHMRVHADQKRYVCHYCNSSFDHNSELKVHSLKHTVEKNYRCLQCEKSFSGMSALKQHNRVHTGEKPFQCMQCGREFSQRSSLNRHQRLHGNDGYHGTSMEL